MELNKYYLPEIEEFYIGFEYERFIPRSNATEEECWNKLLMSINYLSLDDIDNEIIDKEIRVKYLDQEDIESLDWRVSENNPLLYTKQNYMLSNIWNEFKISVKEPNSENREFIFKGNIKNKSELKKLMKQLNINDSQ